MVNYYVLAVFAPVLVLTGILGFVVPKDKAITSGAAPYNIFHIAFGLIGLGIVFAGHESYIRAFNITFGFIDLYQAAANRLNWFPQAYFKWKRADDILHIIIGALLVVVGIVAG